VTNLEPEDWLKDLDQGTVNAPLTHPRIENFAERVAEQTAELRKEQQLVTSRSELRNTAALNQTE
jgi:hypothetical protein